MAGLSTASPVSYTTAFLLFSLVFAIGCVAEYGILFNIFGLNIGEVLLISLNSLFGLNLGVIMWDQKYKVGMLDLRRYCFVVSLVCQLEGDWPLNFTESFLGVNSSRMYWIRNLDQ